MKKVFCVIVILLFIFTNSIPAFAGTGPDTWAGNFSANLGDSNWSGTNNPPLTGDSLVFGAAGTSGTSLSDTLASLSINGITYSSGAAAFNIAGSGGNTFTLTGALANDSSSNETLGMGLAGTVTNSGTGSGSITLSSNIGPGVTAVTQNSNTSTLILTGNNTYTGLTTLAAGILNLGSSNAIGSGSTIIFNGGTLQYSAASHTIDYSSQFSAGANQAYNIDTNGQTVTFATALSSSGGVLTKLGLGTLVLSAVNTYSGATNINGGTLQINASDNLGNASVSNTIHMNGGTLESTSGTYDLGVNRSITLAGAGGTIQADSGQLTVSGGVGGTGNLNLDNNSATAGGVTISTTGVNNTGLITNSGTGSGSTIISSNIGSNVTGVTQDSNTSALVLTGNNTYNAPTTLAAGILNLGSSNAIGSGTIFFNGGTLQYSASNNTDYSSRFSAGANQAYNIDTNGRNVILAHDLTSSAGSLTKAGSGTLTLTGNNTFSGATTLTAGILNLGSVNAIAIGTTGVGSTINFNGGTLQYSASNTYDYSGQFSTDAGQQYSIDTNGQIVTFATALSSSGGSLTKLGLGAIVLSADNTYTGVTNINGGFLQISASDNLGDGSSTNTIGMNGGTLESTAGTYDLGVNRSIALSAGGGTIQVDAGQLTISGAVSGPGNLTFINDSASPIILSNSGNDYTGTTTISAGTLQLGAAGAIPAASNLSIAASGTLDLGGFSDTIGLLSGSGTITSSTAGSAILTSGTSGSSAFSGNIQNGSANEIVGITKEGSGTLTLSGDNTYSGATTVNGGTLAAGVVQAFGAGSAMSVASGSILDLSGFSQAIGSLAGGGTVTSNAAGSINLTIGGNSSAATFSGTIGDGSGTVALVKMGAYENSTNTGVQTLSGANTYSGGTTINEGTLAVRNSNALSTGAVVNNAALDVGLTNLSLAGSYTQNPGSALDVTIQNFTLNPVFYTGKITSTSATPMTISGGSAINVTVAGYVPLGSTIEIINTTDGMAGSSAAPATVTSTSRFVNFTDSISGGDLYLTAVHSTNGFVSLADTLNGRAAGTALDNLINPSKDMNVVLNSLEFESLPTITAALNTLGPIVDGGVRDNSTAVMDNFVGTSLQRLQDINDALDRVDKALNGNGSGNIAVTGISSGSEAEQNGIWAKPYGSYLIQATHQQIEGYNAWNAGTVVGVDRLIFDDFTLGLSGGYAYGRVNSDANNAVTDLTSAQGSIYAGYQNPEHNYFINAAGTFAWDWYDGQRDINLGAINRTADSTYDGQQYGLFLGGGYKIHFGDTLELTPLASIQWSRLDLSNYAETGAGSLDLGVDKQTYDLLESGVGASISTEKIYYWGVFTPEFHAKWLYDYINDPVTIMSSFAGGGGSFTSNGATPSKNGIDIGSKLTFDFVNDISFIAECDAEMKSGYIGVYGSGTIHYKF